MIATMRARDKRQKERTKEATKEQEGERVQNRKKDFDKITYIVITFFTHYFSISLRTLETDNLLFSILNFFIKAFSM